MQPRDEHALLSSHHSLHNRPLAGNSALLRSQCPSSACLLASFVQSHVASHMHIFRESSGRGIPESPRASVCMPSSISCAEAARYLGASHITSLSTYASVPRHTPGNFKIPSFEPGQFFPFLVVTSAITQVDLRVTPRPEHPNKHLIRRLNLFSARRVQTLQPGGGRDVGSAPRCPVVSS